MEKSLLNISGIIAFIVGILACITIVGAIVGVPLIIGGNKLRDLAMASDEEVFREKDTILIWTIVFMYLCQISGVLSLIFYILMLNKYNESITGGSNFKPSGYQELEELKKIYDDGIITKKEYEERKAKILERM